MKSLSLSLYIYIYPGDDKGPLPFARESRKILSLNPDPEMRQHPKTPHNLQRQTQKALQHQAPNPKTPNSKGAFLKTQTNNR